LDSVKGLLVSYSGLILQMPDMFPQNDMTALGPDQLVPKLLAGIDNTSGLPAEFVEELANRFANDGLETVGSSVIG
jgi:ubiquitin conjugation factor E4 B